MTLGFMQQIDRWLGVPLARLLGLFSAKPRGGFLGGVALVQPPRRVICAKFVGLGSVALSLPLLAALKEAGVEVLFWTFAGNATILEISGSVTRVLKVKSTVWGFPVTLLSTLLQAIRFKPDAFLDLEQTSNASAILARLSGARVRVGFLSGKAVRERLFTHQVSLAGDRHMSHNMALMARSMGLSFREPIQLPPLQLSRVDSITNRKLIVINANTSDLGATLRQWPEDSWVKLCSQLLQDESVDLVFPGVSTEQKRNAAIIEKLGQAAASSRVRNAAGRSSIEQLLRMLQEASLVVSVDSGVMHLAAWAGAPVVGLFGPETPMLYAPLTKRSKVLWAALPCSPCCTVATEKHTRCTDNQCMKRLSVGQVYMACTSLLQETSRAPRRAA